MLTFVLCMTLYQVIPVSVSSRDDDKVFSSLGLRSGSEWEVFSVKNSPGEYIKHTGNPKHYYQNDLNIIFSIYSLTDKVENTWTILYCVPYSSCPLHFLLSIILQPTRRSSQPLLYALSTPTTY